MNTNHQGGSEGQVPRVPNPPRTIRWQSKEGAHESDVDEETFRAIRTEATREGLSLSQVARAMHAAGKLQPTRTAPPSGAVAPPLGGPRVFMECTKEEKALWVWAAQNMEGGAKLEAFMREAMNEKAARIVSDMIKSGKHVPQNIAEQIGLLNKKAETEG